ASGCGHAAVDCDDQNACTTDTCDKLTGCRNDYACDDGNACTTDTCDKSAGCGHADLTCWDGNACTTDTCDPGKGCVFPEIHPCCGDALVEAPETCDPGDAGADLCGDTCESVTLLLEGEGRAPAAAGDADGGALACERVALGRMGVRVRLVDDHGKLGQIHNIEGPSWAPESGGPRPVLAPLLPGTFLLGAYVRLEAPPDAFAVKLTPITEEGPVIQEPVHIPLAKKPGSGIFLDVSGSTGIVTWGEGNTGGNDQDALWARISLGGTKATPGPATRVVPEGRRSLPGGACAGPEAHVVVWVEDAGMDIIDSVTRVLPNGDVDTYELAKFKADMPIPPRCTAAAEGFLAVWGDIGEWGGKQAFRLWSRKLDAYGLPAGKAAVSIGQWDAFSDYACYPWLASVARTGTGFAVAVACGAVAADQPVSMKIELWRLDQDGKPVDGSPEVVPGQEGPFAIDVASAWGPGTSALVAWQETVSVSDSSLPWSPIRVRALGQF
ncbi:MAG: hypothetical protein FJ087_23535, partial [Deltaproteobacteria bacterium]|nr:hypothetical protein [Deltaproteobacteria bacterium]